MHQPARLIEILLHARGINDQLFDHARGARQGEVERHRRIGADEAFDRGVRNIALVPQRHIFQRRPDISAHHARQPDDILAQDRVALMGHRRGALLAGGKIFFRFQNLGALQMTNFDRQTLQ